MVIFEDKYKQRFMEITAERIAEHLKGEIIGDPNVKVSMVAKIETGKPHNVCILHNDKYSKYLLTSNAGIVIVSRHLVPEQKVKPTLIVMEDAHPAYAMLLDLLNTIKKSRKKEISSHKQRSHQACKTKSSSHLDQKTNKKKKNRKIEC